MKVLQEGPFWRLGKKLFQGGRVRKLCRKVLHDGPFWRLDRKLLQVGQVRKMFIRELLKEG